MLFLILTFNGCFSEGPAIKMLVGPSAPPMIETPFLLFAPFVFSSQIPIEQNRCAMACQGCGAVLFFLKSSGITFHNPLLLSYHTKQLN